MADATLLLWDRRLDTFQVLSSGGAPERELTPGQVVNAPEAGFLLSDGLLLETPTRTEGLGGQDGILVPLLARSGLVGMLVLGARRGRRRRPLRVAETRALSSLAARAALALENHLYQHELIASERMAALGTMAGMLAHDFRGPMTVIRGYAETIAEDAGAPSEIRERALHITRNVDRLERMTTETLDFARVGRRLARRSLDLRSLLEELAAGVQAELPTLEVLRDFRVPSNATAAPRDKLRRVVGNIAANAGTRGGKGRLRLRRAGRADAGGLRACPHARGRGAGGEIRDRLFEPFVTRGKKSGTGLGLAVARRFVEDHGGTLELLPAGRARASPCRSLRAADGTPGRYIVAVGDRTTRGNQPCSPWRARRVPSPRSQGVLQVGPGDVLGRRLRPGRAVSPRAAPVLNTEAPAHGGGAGHQAQGEDAI